MIMPISWQYGFGLSVGDGFSSKREGAEFKHQVNQREDEMRAEGLPSDVSASITGDPHALEQINKGLSIGVVVEQVLINFSEATRQVSVAIEEAKSKGNMDEAKKLFDDLACFIVPRFRNMILAAMDSLNKDDHRALRRVLEVTDKLEKFRMAMAQEQATPTAPTA